MASASLTQAEADALIAMAKFCHETKPYEYPPDPGQVIKVPLVSEDEAETFILSMRRGSISLSKATYLLRARVSIPLVRLDTEGGPHTNPDPARTLVPCPHLHVYREGYGDRWAFPVPDVFTNLDDLRQTFLEFMGYCNVVKSPRIQQRI